MKRFSPSAFVFCMGLLAALASAQLTAGEKKGEKKDAAPETSAKPGPEHAILKEVLLGFLWVNFTVSGACR
jgi:hypothetical protein